MNLTLPPKVTPRAFQRLAEINSDASAAKALRVAVEGGGCSGFQYDIRLDDPPPGDLILEGDCQKVLIGAVYRPVLSHAISDVREEVIGARSAEMEEAA